MRSRDEEAIRDLRMQKRSYEYYISDLQAKEAQLTREKKMMEGQKALADEENQILRKKLEQYAAMHATTDAPPQLGLSEADARANEAGPEKRILPSPDVRIHGVAAARDFDVSSIHSAHRHRFDSGPGRYVCFLLIQSWLPDWFRNTKLSYNMHRFACNSMLSVI